MTIGKSRAKLVGAIVVGLSLAACGDRARIDRGDVDFEQYTAQQIFERAEYDLARNNPGQAADVFGQVERLYPYSEWAKRALIMQAFSYHKDQDYENSRAAAALYRFLSHR